MELGLLILAYFIGSIPTGYLVGRSAGIDIREYGSGSTGAANVWRTLGKGKGIFVFGVDLIKGAATISLIQSATKFKPIANAWLTGSFEMNIQLQNEWIVVSSALLVILGHSYSCWINFKGGKSVATGLGILLALNWSVALGAFGLWLATVVVWRTTSISSSLAAIAAPSLMLLTQSPFAYKLMVCVGSLLILYRHRSNLDRLWHGTEQKISFFESDRHESISTN
ncbi:glycerol-3-phosphate 1-O-acyltransferase PlsY [Pseudanabaena sp. FACHB-1998]|uniref:glycerol-3-phosphate 1-O-acyltransferase PlsY n=1 Tax=Pseudanabaena sp. FACHB-1998 TaxID=2692858 RepID=UPI0016811CCF|nr:glycerol-3-phosphate 1-O-acyltransferase PlsY [Pseudanabaena sp. FACHB-1998]MBD2178265.1 glycerol-3-phosphate 1-O-acyltransferase PlsY [Pseudanabaena sp. FACHB-1998]